MYSNTLSRGAPALGSGGLGPGGSGAANGWLSNQPALSQTDRTPICRGQGTDGITAGATAWTSASVGAMSADGVSAKHQTHSGRVVPTTACGDCVTASTMAAARASGSFVAAIPRRFRVAGHRLELNHARQKLHPFFNSLFTIYGVGRVT